MEKLHQSPMIGEVLAGILVGPMVLRLINPDPTTSFGASLNVVANLGVFILVLLAGIELGREGLRKAFKERSMVVAFVEFFLPFSLGYSFAARRAHDWPRGLEQCPFHRAGLLRGDHPEADDSFGPHLGIVHADLCL